MFRGNLLPIDGHSNLDQVIGEEKKEISYLRKEMKRSRHNAERPKRREMLLVNLRCCNKGRIVHCSTVQLGVQLMRDILNNGTNQMLFMSNILLLTY